MELTRGNLNRLLLTLQRALEFGLEVEGDLASRIERELREAIILVNALKTAVNREQRKKAHEDKERVNDG